MAISTVELKAALKALLKEEPDLLTVSVSASSSYDEGTSGYCVTLYFDGEEISSGSDYTYNQN